MYKNYTEKEKDIAYARGLNIDKNNIVINGELNIVNKITENINLVNILQEILGDPLLKYKNHDVSINEENKIDANKIPNSLYITAISRSINIYADKIGSGICTKNDKIYTYTSSYWELQEKDTVKRLASQFTSLTDYHSPATAQSVTFQNNLYDQILQDGIMNIKNKNTDDKVLINLKNGTLEIDDSMQFRLRGHDKDDFMTYCLPYNYHPDIEAPIWNNFLKEVLPDEELRAILQEFMGYIFINNLKLEKMLVLFGSGSNGKSVIFEVITALLGKENISSKGLGDVCKSGSEGSNHRAGLQDKLLNYGSEIKPKNIDNDIFKALASSEPVTMKILYKDVMDAPLNTKFIFNANTLPTNVEHTGGYFRRFIIIPFENIIPKSKRDPNLHKKIIDSELAGVLNWCIIGTKRLLENEAFTYSDKVESILNRFKMDTNNILQFIEEFSVENDDNKFISNEELYGFYFNFCESNSYKAFSKNNFSKNLISLGYKKYSKRIGGKLYRGFKINISR